MFVRNSSASCPFCRLKAVKLRKQEAFLWLAHNRIQLLRASLLVAGRRCASLGVAARRCASLRVAPRRCASLRVAPRRSASLRVAPRRSASLRVAPRRPASLRVGSPLSARLLVASRLCTSLRVAARRCASPYIRPARRSATSSKLRNTYNLHWEALSTPGLRCFHITPYSPRATTILQIPRMTNLNPGCYIPSSTPQALRAIPYLDHPHSFFSKRELQRAWFVSLTFENEIAVGVMRRGLVHEKF